MTTADMIRASTSVVSRTATGLARWGRFLRHVLFLNLADDRIAPRRSLSVLLESGGVAVTLHSRFLSRTKTRGTRHFPFEAGAYAPPEGLASAVALAANAFGAARAPVTLVVPKAWTILKTADFPRVVKENLTDVIAYELDRLTPLSPERAYYDFQVITEDEERIRILIAAMKNDTLQPYLDALADKGIAIERVGVAAPGLDREGAEGIVAEMNLLEKGLHRRPKTPLALTLLLLALLIAAGLLWMVSPLRIEEQKAAIIDREIAVRKEEIKKVEAMKQELAGLEQEIAAINHFRTARPLTLELLKEMTRIMPDNAWLSRVRFTESTVEIEGYAASATDTLPKLEASRYFKKVEFASPTTRDVRLNADRFIIKMEIESLPEEKGTDERKK